MGLAHLKICGYAFEWQYKTSCPKTKKVYTQHHVKADPYQHGITPMNKHLQGQVKHFKPGQMLFSYPTLASDSGSRGGEDRSGLK